MQITLLRHGKPDIPYSHWTPIRRIGEGIREYDRSSIIKQPPMLAKEIIANSDAVVCSHLRRSKDSAEVLGAKNILFSDELFREVEMPHIESSPIPLPAFAWGLIFRNLSFIGFSRNGESPTHAKERAHIAANKLIELSQSHRNVVLVGHAMFNYFIAKSLISKSWQGPSIPQSKHWGISVYQKI